MKSFSVDIFLVITTISLVIAMFFYTDIAKVGVAQFFKDSIKNIENIYQEKNLETEVNTEKKIEPTESFLETQKDQKLFCNSSYFPFLAGASWNYQISTGSNNENKENFSLGIPSPEKEKYFLDGRITSWKNWTVRTIMRCKNNQIELTDLNLLDIFNWKNIVTKPCENDVFSFYLPQDSDLNKEKKNTWITAGCLKREIIDEKDAEKKILVDENIEINWKIVGKEKIKVPAGEYEATKINLEVSEEQKINELNKNIESQINLWVAEGIGIVKISNQEKSVNNNPSDKTEIVQELTSFQIPTGTDYKRQN